MSIGAIASQAFSPNKIAGLELWLDASDLGYIIDSGGAVSQWSDKKHIFPIDAVQSTGVNQPKTGIETINGLNAIDFDGNSQYFAADGAGSIPLSDHTIFFVSHLRTPDELQCFLSWNFNTGSSNAQLFCYTTTLPGRLDARGSIGTNTLINKDLRNIDTFITITVEFGTTIVTRLNGVQETSLAISSVPTPTSFVIGAELDAGNTPGNFVDIKVGEIIMYDGVLSLAEILEMENYLANKWWAPLVFPFAFSADFSSDFS